MKKVLGISLFLLFGMTGIASAQDKDRTKEARKEIKQGAKKAGNKTAEVASKGKSKITDKAVKEKMGPNGETIYIDNDSRYYWVDKKGRKHFIPEARLKNREELN